MRKPLARERVLVPAVQVRDAEQLFASRERHKHAVERDAAPRGGAVELAPTGARKGDQSRTRLAAAYKSSVPPDVRQPHTDGDAAAVGCAPTRIQSSPRVT